MNNLQILSPNLPKIEFFEKVKNNNIEKCFQVLEKTSIKIQILKSIIPDNKEIDKFKLESDISTIETNITPETIQTCLNITNKILKFFENPTGSSIYDLRLSSILNVLSPFTNNSKKYCLVELRSTRKIFFYDTNNLTKMLGKIFN
jgi:hypothetical protein